MEINRLLLSERTHNCLVKAGVTDTQKIRKLNTKDLENIKGLGEKGLRELIVALSGAGESLVLEWAEEDVVRPYKEKIDAIIEILTPNAKAQLPPEREARREPKARQRFGRSTAAICWAFKG